MAAGACRFGRWGERTDSAALRGRLRAGEHGAAADGGDGRPAWCQVDRATTDTGTTPLLEAAWQGFHEVVKVLLQHRADANKARNDGTTPLHFAAFKGSVKVAEVLLESRANMNKTDKTTMSTPLHLAAFYGHLAIVRLLLQSRADTTLKNQCRRTPLANAREQGHEEVAMLLVQAGRVR